MGMLKDAAKKSAVNTATMGQGGVVDFALKGLKRFRAYRKKQKEEAAAKRKAEAERRADSYEPDKPKKVKPKPKALGTFRDEGLDTLEKIRRRKQRLRQNQ